MKISDNTSISMPMRNLMAILAATAKTEIYQGRKKILKVLGSGG